MFLWVFRGSSFTGTPVNANRDPCLHAVFRYSTGILIKYYTPVSINMQCTLYNKSLKRLTTLESNNTICRIENGLNSPVEAYQQTYQHTGLICDKWCGHSPTPPNQTSPEGAPGVTYRRTKCHARRTKCTRDSHFMSPKQGQYYIKNKLIK